MAAEEKFGVKIPDDELPKLKTVGDAVNVHRDATPDAAMRTLRHRSTTSSSPGSGPPPRSAATSRPSGPACSRAAPASSRSPQDWAAELCGADRRADGGRPDRGAARACRPGAWTAAEQAALVAAREAWADAGFAGKAGRRRARTDPRRRGHRHRHRRRHQPARRSTTSCCEKGPGRVSPLLIPMNMPNGPAALRRARDRRAGRRAHDRSARARPARRRSRYGLDLIAPRPRRRRRGRRHRGVHPPAQHRRLRADARDVDPQRRAAARVASVGQGPRRLRARRGRRRAGARAARRRRRPAAATPYAVLAGAGITSDAYDIVQPDRRHGQVRAMHAAPSSAPGIDLDDIVHVNAHATSTPVGDMGEAGAIADLLGEHTVVTATKSMTGHLLGAAGAIESIATVLAVQQRRRAADDQPRRPGRRRCASTSRARPARCRCRPRSTTRSASAATTSSLLFRKA